MNIPSASSRQLDKNKLYQLVVDFKPGGGTDIQALYFASNWGKFIPCNPRVATSEAAARDHRTQATV